MDNVKYNIEGGALQDGIIVNWLCGSLGSDFARSIGVNLYQS
jgi:hypothetical protein